MSGEILLTDFEMILLVLAMSIVFMILILLFFFYWKSYRKDKLTNFASIEERLEINSTLLNLDPTFNKKHFVELANLKSNNLFNNNFVKKLNKERKKVTIPNDINNTFFGWFFFVKNIDDTELYNLINAEGFMYLYFLKTTAFLFFIMSLISLFLILPIITYNDHSPIRSPSNPYTNALYSNSTNLNQTKLDFLQSLTAKNVYNNEVKIYLILLISYIICIMGYYHVYNYKKKLDLMSEYNKDDDIDNDVSVHSIHIREINKHLSYKESSKLLEDFFKIHFYDDVISIQVIPNYDKIVKLINEMFQLQCELNKIERNNYLLLKKVTKKINGVVVDYETYLKEKVKIIDKLKEYYRKLIARKTTGNAFICFKNPQTAKKILKNKSLFINQNKNTFHGSILQMENWRIKKASSPSDLIWQNIKYTKRNRLLKMILFTAILFYACLFVITPKVVSL